MKPKRSTPTPTPTPNDYKRSKRKIDHHSNTININNHDVCDACGDHGQFLCCDACPNAFHFTCVEPPLTSDDVKKLKGNWYCNECKPRKLKRTQTERNYTGLFLPLIEDIDSKNPTTFRLPSSIANHFKGVSSDKQGRYIDTSRIKPARYKNGYVEHPDYHQLKDKAGNFRCCYYCRMTALKKPMIACDYCPLYWHLDCLTPPLAIPPNPARKWRCPNHFEHFTKPKREVKNPSATTIITTHDENRIPPCSFQYGLSILIEQELKELEDNKHINRTPKKTKTDDIIVGKEGTVYRLPSDPIKLNFSNYVKNIKQTASCDK
ncbi:hypothetical protein BD770DRAFT_58119 [Pilaira anomala]|nr:hypothetical protein BD770DRAFT_58119 [Pilaira anomala]